MGTPIHMLFNFYGYFAKQQVFPVKSNKKHMIHFFSCIVLWNATASGSRFSPEQVNQRAGLNATLGGSPPIHSLSGSNF